MGCTYTDIPIHHPVFPNLVPIYIVPAFNHKKKAYYEG